MATLRRADVFDLFAMQNANFINLPENYIMKYYFFHAVSWPQLLSVSHDSQGKLVGYVLAKLACNGGSFRRRLRLPACARHKQSRLLALQAHSGLQNSRHRQGVLRRQGRCIQHEKLLLPRKTKNEESCQRTRSPQCDVRKSSGEGRRRKELSRRCAFRRSEDRGRVQEPRGRRRGCEQLRKEEEEAMNSDKQPLGGSFVSSVFFSLPSCTASSLFLSLLRVLSSCSDAFPFSRASGLSASTAQRVFASKVSLLHSSSFLFTLNFSLLGSCRLGGGREIQTAEHLFHIAPRWGSGLSVISVSFSTLSPSTHSSSRTLSKKEKRSFSVWVRDRFSRRGNETSPLDESSLRSRSRVPPLLHA